MDVLAVIFGIVFLGLIGYHIYKIVKVQPLSPSDYPQMPAEKFNEWKKLELQSSYIFLTTFVVYFLLINITPKNIIFLIIAVLILPGGIIAAILEAKNAGKIKKNFQVDWKRPVQKINTLPTAPSMELEFWRTIKDSKNPEDFKAYILTYPKGQFVELAKNQVREFRKSTVTENRA